MTERWPSVREGVSKYVSMTNASNVSYVGQLALSSRSINQFILKG